MIYLILIIPQEPLLLAALQGMINPLQPGVAFLYPVKTSRTLKFSDIFREYRKATPGCNGLIQELFKFRRSEWVKEGRERLGIFWMVEYEIQASESKVAVLTGPHDPRCISMFQIIV